MDKILVEVYVPYLQDSYDVLIPQKTQMGEISILIASIVSEINLGLYSPETEPVICDIDGNPLNVNATVEEIKIENGAKLILL